MAQIDDIRRQAARETRVIESLTAEFTRDLDRTLAQLNRQIRRLVGSLDQKNGRLVANRASLGRALRLRAELQTAIEAAGYNELLVQSMDVKLDRLTVETLRGRTIAGRAARVTPFEVEAITAFKDIRRANLLELGDDAATALWQGTLDGVVGARSSAALVDELAEVVGVTSRQARTLHDTSISTYSRQVDQLGIDPQPGDRFLYVGPQDTETRPFCAGLVGEIRTREELDSLDNGQLPNTLLTGGGFNCRHAWKAIGQLTREELAA